MTAVILLSFDPYVTILGLTVPLRAIGLALAVAVALLVATAFARGFPQLRRDDLLYLVVGAVPGAIAGGRIVHALAHLDYYANDPGALLDPARGSLSLLGAVLGGTASAAAVARMVGAPFRAWLGAAAVPLLLAIGLGKIAQLLGGGGQGTPFDGPSAVAFGGTGPWLSAGASLPSHPSQLYESLWAIVGIPAIVVVAMSREWRWRRPASLFGLAIAWWLVGRVVIGSTWRDSHGLGPLNAEQALALVALGVLAGGVAFAGWRAERQQPELLAPVATEVLPVERVEARQEPLPKGRGKRRRRRERRMVAGETDNSR